ncbi:MAG: sugar kinase [Rhodobacteraceae bacterium]|nr:sugar kinase [Paracoccaceae bacterium]
MKQFLSIGECMLELSQADGGLWQMGVAGDTLNTAWYARRLLGKDWDVAYFTRLGEGRFSDQILKFLESAGLNTSYIGTDPAREPGLYAISLDQGERSFSYWRGQSAARHLADDEAALTGAINSADIIYFSGITLAILADGRRAALLAALGAAKAAGKIVAFDPNIRPKLWQNTAAACDWIMRAAAVSTIILPSYDDEADAFGDADPAATLARYRAAGVAEIIVKNGGGAVVFTSPDGMGSLDDLARVTPVDTTGAGDSFNGGYLCARLGGATVQTALQAGHDLASHVVMAKGALVSAAC